MDPLEALQTRIDGFAKAGRTAPWGGETRLAASCAHLDAAAQTLRGLYRATTNSVVLSTFSCGSDQGLAVVVIEGNYKDEATLVASAAVATAFLDELEAPLLAEADIPPLLRRARVARRVRGLREGRSRFARTLDGICAG
jgi:hypothetical protein